ncbi:DUF3833 domain-containing protein [Alphaproteobacteria bacterium]|nr:DUF3833 domain-containing protein [Alphaproteobacteria bacterium]
MNSLASKYSEATLSKTFMPEEFFDGRIEATGVFIDRFGSVRRRFNVSIDGKTTKDGFLLDEYFSFDDGENEYRQWQITKSDQNTYVGFCKDVCGQAVGKLTDAQLSWNYYFNLTLFSRKIKVKFEDVMIQQSPLIMLNNAKVKKFGLLLGEVFITFIKTSQSTSESPLSAADRK